MKHSRVNLSLLVASAFVLAGGAGLALRAADKPADAKPPLKIHIDATEIDRDAAQRVSYADIVEKAAASVVNVSSSRTVHAPANEFFSDPMFRHFFNIPDNMRRGRAQKEKSLGSGVVLTSDGYIVTNNHVVEGAQDVEVSFGTEGESGKKYKATIVGRDQLVDLALLKIDAKGLPTATLADSATLKVGDVVFAIGNPFNLNRTVTHGIVSAIGRDGLGIEQVESFIQTDAAINPGNSGGALVDSKGRLIGINTAILSNSGASNGVGFAIPVSIARSRLEMLYQKGRIERGFLGVGPQPEFDSELAAQLGVAGGVLIDDVTEKSPADKAGLKSGDVITKINGQAVSDPARLVSLIAQLQPGTVISIEYVRDHKTATVQATLAPYPQDKVMAGSTEPEGNDTGVLNHVQVTDLTAEIRQQLNCPKNIQGAVVTEVAADSASAAAGLQEGDIIRTLNGRPVRDANEAVKLSAEIKGPKVIVGFWREGRNRYVVVDESGSGS